MDFNDEQENQLEILLKKYLGEGDFEYDETLHEIYIKNIDESVKYEVSKNIKTEALQAALDNDTEKLHELAEIQDIFFLTHNNTCIDDIIDECKQKFLQTQANKAFNTYILKTDISEIEDFEYFSEQAVLDNIHANDRYMNVVLDKMEEYLMHKETNTLVFGWIGTVHAYVNGTLLENDDYFEDKDDDLIQMQGERDTKYIYDQIHKYTLSREEQLEEAIEVFDEEIEKDIINIERIYESRKRYLLHIIQKQCYDIESKEFQKTKTTEHVHNIFNTIITNYCEYEFLKTKTHEHLNPHSSIQANLFMYNMIVEAANHLPETSEDAQLKTTKLRSHLFASTNRN